ncbi:hypothetical protein [Evansella cellulosilytica]|uniref:Uncharacterized protein n=1 Tax=Evansella cellulosilytica (strain ATCC 21833 / DSM 2522 / FERM P-1141 / JCM 9156 / N-4) TaxID=649639 RepID=E6TZQ6_EVAC2|nr:hypothetical protein [Evansella cellulosilytica]ADU31362.1 hypothetical protein Bcell_3119 [Evansella cellulosilytica DSM 2522]
MFRRRRSFRQFRWPRWFQRGIDVLYQILLPLIILQFLRILFLPTTFDIILLGALVILYLSHQMGWFSK